MPYSNLQKGRYSQSNQIYHLTWTTHNRNPNLANLETFQIIKNEFKLLSKKEVLNTLCFVIMPDHIHWLVELNRGDLSKEVRKFKSFTSKAIKQKLNIDESIWQRGFYDRAIRREEDLVGVARYIVMNPVRAGICKSVREYPYWDAMWLD